MYAAEETLASIKALENWRMAQMPKKCRSVGDTPSRFEISEKYVSSSRSFLPCKVLINPFT
jgi:hypothetical protein